MGWAKHAAWINEKCVGLTVFLDGKHERDHLQDFAVEGKII
jgi:hypothetical protein